MGAAYRDKLAAGEADVETVMRFGVSTVRPSEDAATLARRMGDQGVTRVVVTRPDGTPGRAVPRRRHQPLTPGPGPLLALKASSWRPRIAR
jgi:hypothetical protein